MSNLKPRVVAIEPGKQRYMPLFKDNLDTLRMKSGCVCLSPGESVGEHITDNREEVIVLLSGQALVTCEGNDPMTAQGPSAIYIPPEKRHDVKNTGDGPLVYVYVVALLNG